MWGRRQKSAHGARTVRGRIACLVALPWAAVSALSADYTAEHGVVYAAPDGKKLRSTLYLPEGGDGPWPAIVLIHGGGFLFGTRYQQLWYCRNFAKRGYVVMTIGYRMLPEYPFPHCVHDSKAAVRWLRANAATYGVDPERIAAFGASAGGHLSAFLATTSEDDGFEGTENLGTSSEVRCAISLYGMVDLTQYRRDTSLKPLQVVPNRLLNAFTGKADGEDTEDPWAWASPITYAGPETAPIMFVHGTRDFLVGVRQSEAFHERLRELGVPTQLILVQKRNHGFDYVHWKERRRIFQDMLAFLETHLQSSSATCSRPKS
jgi:acetyl esterase/lipase